MYKRFLLILAIVFSVGLGLGYGREALAKAPVLIEDGQEGAATTEQGTDSILLSETFKLLSTDPITDGRYGRAVAVSGDTLIVGETKGNTNNIPGEVYIYERDHGGVNNWGLVKIISASDSVDRDHFGTSLVLDGDTLIVSALLGDGNASGSGAAYIFERDAGGPDNWGKVTKLTASDGATDDRFGWSVDLEGDTAVVGAMWQDSEGSNTGATYIYERDSGGPNNWGEVRKVTASDPASGDFFGVSVALDQDTLIIGACKKNENGSDSGAVYVLERNQGGTNNWGEVTKLVPIVSTSFDEFGRWVAIEDDMVVGGAHQPTSDGPGYAVVYQQDHSNPDTWIETAQLIPSDGANGDQFGVVVRAAANTIYVGARLGDGLTDDTGAAYVFARDPDDPHSWLETHKLIASDGEANDEFAYDLGFSGANVIVGAFENDDLCPTNPNCGSGSAYFYTLAEAADVAISKSVSSDTAVPNQPITYTLTFTNNGTDVAFGTVITDLVPASIVNPIFTSSGAMITQTDNALFSWQVANLAPGEGGIITVTGIISSELVSETIIVNTAVITNSLDSTPSNNSDTAVTQVTIPEVNLSTADYAVAEDSGWVTVTAVLSPPQPYLDVIVSYETADGTALTGEDYTAVSGILTFTPGITLSSFMIPITDDLLVEADETAFISLTNFVNATPGTPITTTLTILDNDKKIPPPETTYLYLPIIVRPSPTPPTAFPIHIGDAIAARPVVAQGEVFYTATIQIPTNLPATGQFFLSTDVNAITAVSIDDELVFIWQGDEVFAKSFSQNGQPVQPEIVEIPRQTLTLLAGETVTVIYRDVYSVWVSATPLWLIWIP